MRLRWNPLDTLKLFEFPTVIATPHTGAHTREAIENMAKAAIQNLIDVLTGKRKSQYS